MTGWTTPMRPQAYDPDDPVDGEVRIKPGDFVSNPHYWSVALRVISWEESCEVWEPGDSYEWKRLEEAITVGRRLVCRMVGDDGLIVVDASDCTLLDDDEFCHSCGQTGCAWH